MLDDLVTDIETFDQILEIKANIRNKLKNYDLTHHTIEVELQGEPCSMG